MSHDLRTPLASAKASVSSLRSSDVAWSDADRDELLETADDALDKLTDLVTNLLDLSRLQAGVLPVMHAPVGLDDVVSRALDHAAADHAVDVDVPAELSGPGIPGRDKNLFNSRRLTKLPGKSVFAAATADHQNVHEEFFTAWTARKQSWWRAAVKRSG